MDFSGMMWQKSGSRPFANIRTNTRFSALSTALGEVTEGPPNQEETLSPVNITDKDTTIESSDSPGSSKHDFTKFLPARITHSQQLLGGLKGKVAKLTPSFDRLKIMSCASSPSLQGLHAERIAFKARTPSGSSSEESITPSTASQQQTISPRSDHSDNFQLPILSSKSFVGLGILAANTLNMEGLSENAPSHGNPYDINGTNFIPEKFINKIISDYSLNKLMETESSLIRQIQDLDSDMHTLVYENYNKFILATDTIRKMKTDFREMEDRMALLSKNIALITDNSAKVCGSLKEKRDKVSRLSGINDLLKKLKFLFELPNKLKQFCEDNNYEEAVKCYLNGVQFVNEFKRFPSLEAIKVDCQHIIKSIKDDLYEDFNDEEKSSQDLTRNVSLLLSLGESSNELGRRLLENALPKLNQTLECIKIADSPNVPLEEFMEIGCGIFLSNLSLVIASFSQIFIQTSELDETVRLESQEMLKTFTVDLMNNFMSIMEHRLTSEEELNNIKDAEQRDELVKALDRLYRRLMAMGTLMPNTDFAPCGLDLTFRVAKLDADLSLQRIKKSFDKAVKDSSVELNSHPGSSQEILGSILATLVLQMKSSLNKLQEFCRADLQFAQNSDFRQKMAILSVREGLVVALFKYLAEFGRNLIQDEQYSNLTWLLLAKLYLDIEIGTVEYMVNSVETEFDIRRDKRNQMYKLTNVSSLTTALNETAKALVREFVSCQGNAISELMKAAVLRNDLMSISHKPKGPSQQMKQVIEVLTVLEKQVDAIFPDSDSVSYFRSERSSDSSRRSISTNPGSRGPTRPSIWSNFDPNMATNIQKLFSEKVEIFGNVELYKSDIMMAIVKIGLRALLECMRQKTLSDYGLHQIQVDVLYLQMYLWRFVNNESFLYSLLDEILASSIQRCVNPTLMETSLVESLAEK